MQGAHFYASTCSGAAPRRLINLERKDLDCVAANYVCSGNLDVDDLLKFNSG
ncbi:hypothetical protein MTsPCn5_09040 [Croceitalea sp. MTPC5]|nr:hypothetical protein MTsPCn5_09040 [Croceitalea sp. MTPC5]